MIGLKIQSSLSSERARVEDDVEARVVRDVRVGTEVAIPAGSRALGSVMVVERGGKFKERARLGIRFHTLVLGDGSRLPITTDTIYRYGEAPGDGSAKKIGGGAVAGAILGAIIGGAKGAAVGATAGAGGGSADGDVGRSQRGRVRLRDRDDRQNHVAGHGHGRSVTRARHRREAAQPPPEASLASHAEPPVLTPEPR